MVGADPVEVAVVAYLHPQGWWRQILHLDRHGHLLDGFFFLDKVEFLGNEGANVTAIASKEATTVPMVR